MPVGPGRGPDRHSGETNHCPGGVLAGRIPGVLAGRQARLVAGRVPRRLAKPFAIALSGEPLASARARYGGPASLGAGRPRGRCGGLPRCHRLLAARLTARPAAPPSARPHALRE